MADEIGAGTDLTSALSRRIADKADRLKYLIIILAVVVVGAILLVTTMRRSGAAREVEAENSMFRAMSDLEKAPESDAMAMLGKVSDEYRGLPPAARADIARFAYSYNTGEYATAEQVARDFLKTYSGHGLASRMRLGLGQAILMQGRTPEAMDIFNELIARESPDVFPEAKLALAQAKEIEAEAVKDDPEEYRRRLEAASIEYNDIIVRSQIAIPSQRGFWPQVVTLPAQFALASIKDKLMGFEHQAPATPDTPLTDAEREAVMAIPPPADTEAGAAETQEGDMPEPPATDASGASGTIETPVAALAQ